jgi:hypothetical protein
VQDQRWLYPHPFPNRKVVICRLHHLWFSPRTSRPSYLHLFFSPTGFLVRIRNQEIKENHCQPRYLLCFHQRHGESLLFSSYVRYFPFHLSADTLVKARMIISASLNTSAIPPKPVTILPSSSSLPSRVCNSATQVFQGANFYNRLEACFIVRSSPSDDQRPHPICHLSVKAQCPRSMVRRQQIFCQQHLVRIAFDGNDLLYRRRLRRFSVDTRRCCHLLRSVALPHSWQSQGLSFPGALN